MPPQEAAPQVPKKSFFSIKTLLIILILILVAGIGLGGYLYLKSTAPEKTGPDPEKLVTFDMGSLLVNLADPGGNSFMKITPVLEYETNKENKKLAEELSKNKIVLQDSIIRVIRKKKMADVQPPESIDKVAEELKTEINSHLQQGKILRVYFSEYLTQ